MIPTSMRAALLHGVSDLRVETIATPEPGPGEVLVRIEACGICPTDARKYAIGVNHGGYPLNPGHEWVGRVVAAGSEVKDFRPDELVYGDTYAGYAEYATIATVPEGQSRGALALGELPLERAIFLEPLADCLHAVHDRAQLQEGTSVAIIGAGSMGLQLTAAAARAGARVLTVEPRAERRSLAERFGAELTVPADGWRESCSDWAGDGPDAVIVTIGRGQLAAEAVQVCAPGGRVVLFAGFGDKGHAPIDLNRLHYEEISLVGSEWVGVPPHQRLDRYEQARELLAGGELPLEELVTDRVGLDGVADALRAVREQRSLKSVLYPGGPR